MTIEQVITKITKMKASMVEDLVVDVTGTAGWVIDKKDGGSGISESNYNQIVSEMNGYNEGQENQVYNGLLTEDVNIIRPSHNPGGSPNG